MTARDVLAIGLLAMVLAGCTAPSPPSDPLPPASDGEREESLALGLVGLWRVAADGEEADTWLRLDDGGFTLWRACGFLGGAWAASEAELLAELTSWHEGCRDDTEIPWLTATAGYRAADDGWNLLDAGGDVTARLRVDGAPPPHPAIINDYREAPEITADVRAAFRVPAALPEHLEPATADDLLGRWAPADGTATEAHVQFTADGRYRGSDGCNGAGGRWMPDVDGLLLTTSGPSTLIGCDSVPVPAWVAAARRVGFDGDVLVLVDLDGQELGRLVAG